MSDKMTLIENGLTPDIIEEVASADLPAGTSELTFLGYFRPGTTDCLIQRVEKIGSVTTFKYPFGRHDYAFAWDDRMSYTYNHRKA